MADATATKNVLSLVATSSSRIRSLPIKDGQLVFIQDLGRIAFDFKCQRVFYNQIVELETEAERQSLDSPLSGYYFVIDTAVLWHYGDDWVQITTKPEEIVFIGVELPELGQEKTLYVDKDDCTISVWDEETQTYITVADKTESVIGSIEEEYINSLF